jgi:hypothetical protein
LTFSRALNHPHPAPAVGPTTSNSDVKATGSTPTSQASAVEQLAVMSGDLASAQDYENHLNNREAINALMAENVSMAASRKSCGRAQFA